MKCFITAVLFSHHISSFVNMSGGKKIQAKEGFFYVSNSSKRVNYCAEG